MLLLLLEDIPFFAIQLTLIRKRQWSCFNILKTSGMLATKLQHLKSLPGLLKKRRTLRAERVELDQRAAQLQIVHAARSSAGDASSESDSESTGPHCMIVAAMRVRAHTCTSVYSSTDASYPSALAQAQAPARAQHNTTQHNKEQYTTTQKSTPQAHHSPPQHARLRMPSTSTHACTHARTNTQSRITCTPVCARTNAHTDPTTHACMRAHTWRRTHCGSCRDCGGFCALVMTAPVAGGLPANGGRSGSVQVRPYPAQQQVQLIRSWWAATAA
jgi:hypothetical protein